MIDSRIVTHPQVEETDHGPSIVDLKSMYGIAETPLKDISDVTSRLFDIHRSVRWGFINEQAFNKMITEVREEASRIGVEFGPHYVRKKGE